MYCKTPIPSTRAGQTRPSLTRLSSRIRVTSQAGPACRAGLGDVLHSTCTLTRTDHLTNQIAMPILLGTSKASFMEEPKSKSKV